jgi:hypothetical protein
MSNNKAIDAADTLNDFIGDLITGVMVLREYAIEQQKGRVIPQQMIAIQKMCLSHLVLTLCKFLEFWEHYHDLVPNEHHNECKALVKNLTKKKVKEFRNKCVGHFWDTGKQRPLVHSEIVTRLEVMIGNDLSNFLNWINNPKNNTYPSTVVSIVETVRDALLVGYSIQPDEIINR